MREQSSWEGKGARGRAGREGAGNGHSLELRILQRGGAALPRTTGTSGRPGQGWESRQKGATAGFIIYSIRLFTCWQRQSLKLKKVLA